MECKRVILGSNPDVQVSFRIPDMCEKDKTIHMNEMKILTLFKDYRPTAKKFLDELLPHLVIGISADKIRQVFWDMPQGGWMEFDGGRKTLSFCYIEKK
jgi:hypothetical protein